ncbi:MAG: hypothetical protein IJL38_01770 [Bacteroidales bacterium]|nr:hypothetical protein [Bacteroidales bacterium]
MARKKTIDVALVYDFDGTLSPFGTIKKTDVERHKWWSSRKLALWIEYVPKNAKKVYIKQLTNPFEK